MALTREQIEQANDRVLECVSVPEWGGDVYVRNFGGEERDAWEASIIGKDGKILRQNFRANLLVRCLCDEAGNLLFGLADVAALSKKSAVVLDRLYDVANRINACTSEAVEDEKKD